MPGQWRSRSTPRASLVDGHRDARHRRLAGHVFCVLQSVVVMFTLGAEFGVPGRRIGRIRRQNRWRQSEKVGACCQVMTLPTKGQRNA